MKSVFRWIWRLVFLASVLMAIAAGTFWIRSYSTLDSVGHVRMVASQPLYIQAALETDSGYCVLDYERTFGGTGWASFRDTSEWGVGHMPNTGGFSVPPGSHHLLGFGFDYENGPADSHGIQSKEVAAWFPLWSVIATCLALATAAFFKLRRRHLPGHCRRCGYDLRATPERCPECGRTGLGH